MIDEIRTELASGWEFELTSTSTALVLPGSEFLNDNDRQLASAKFELRWKMTEDTTIVPIYPNTLVTTVKLSFTDNTIDSRATYELTNIVEDYINRVITFDIIPTQLTWENIPHLVYDPDTKSTKVEGEAISYVTTWLIGLGLTIRLSTGSDTYPALVFSDIKLDVTQNIGEAEITYTEDPTSDSTFNENPTWVNPEEPELSVDLGEIIVTPQLPDVSIPVGSDAARAAQIDYEVQINELLEYLGTGWVITLPWWIKFNIVAIRVGWYSKLKDYAYKSGRTITQILESLTKMRNSENTLVNNITELKKIYLINQNIQNNLVNEYTLVLEDPVPVTGYKVVDGAVVKYTKLTRVLFGKSQGQNLNSIQKSTMSALVDYLDSYIEIMQLTSQEYTDLPIIGKIDLFGENSAEDEKPLICFILDNYNLDPSHGFKLELNPNLFGFLYENENLYDRLVSKLDKIDELREENRDLRDFWGDNWKSYYNQLGFNSESKIDGKPKSESDMLAEYKARTRNQQRPYERQMFEVEDVAVGSTPLTLNKSFVFLYDYYYTNLGVERTTKLIKFLRDAEACIKKVPKEIADIANCVTEPMGAVVVTNTGGGSVVANPIQVLGTINRIKADLNELKQLVGKPLSDARDLGIPSNLLAPLQTIYDILKNF